MIIGLTGSQCAGKDTLIEYLTSQGFGFFSLSTAVREEAKRRNIELTKTNLQDIGNELREREGIGVWAKKALEAMQKNQHYVVVGIRNPGEVEELKKDNNFFLISIDAPQQLRFARMMSRAREGDPTTWENFLKIDARDKGEGESTTGQQVDTTMEMADFNLSNDGDIGEMHNKTKEVLEKIEDVINQRNKLA